MMKKILPLLITLIISSSFLTSCCEDKERKEIKKEIRVEQESGQTTVTITKTEDGKETIEVLTGIEAEEFVDSHEADGLGDSKGHKVIVVKEGDENGKNEKMIWVTDESEGGSTKVDVEVDDDGMITIEKTVDGKTTVKKIKMEDAGEEEKVFIIKTDETESKKQESD